MKKLGIFLLLTLFTVSLFSQAAVKRVWLKKAGTITFEGATEDDFQTVLGAIDPTGSNAINVPDKSGTVALLCDLGCATIMGGGTGQTHAIWTGCGASVTLGDSVIRELAGDVLFDDGVNDILTFDFTTNPTGAINWTLGDVSGLPLIDNGLSAGFFPIATATDGEAVNSGMDQDITNSCTITISGKDLKMENEADNLIVNDIVSAFNSNTFIDLNSAEIRLFVGTGGVTLELRQGAAALLSEDLNVKGDGITNARLFISDTTNANSLGLAADNIVGNRIVQGPNALGTMALWGEETAEDLTVDNTAITSGALTSGTNYLFTVGATSAWDTEPNAVFTPNLPDGVAVPIGRVGRVTSGTDFIPPNYGGATLVPTIPVHGNYIQITSNTGTAADRTRELEDGIAVGQTFTIEFNATANSQWELIGILSTGGGTFTWNSGAAATIQQVMYLQWNGTNWFTRDGIITIIP